MTKRNQAETELDTSPLLATVQRVEDAMQPAKEEPHQQCHSVVDASSYSNNLPSKMGQDSFRLTNSLHCGLLNRQQFL